MIMSCLILNQDLVDVDIPEILEEILKFNLFMRGAGIVCFHFVGFKTYNLQSLQYFTFVLF